MKRETAANVAGLVGLGMLGTGLWLYDPRLSLVTIGGLLIAAAVMGAARC